MNLKDRRLDGFLKTNGFCKYSLGIENVLPELEEIYHQFFLSKDKGAFFVTHNDGNQTQARQIHDKITHVCQPIIDKHIEDYEIYAAHFVIKKAKSGEGFQLHQDWNNIDEKNKNSLQVWIPLSMSYPEKGGIGIFPKSHLFFDNYRSGSIGIPRIKLTMDLRPYLSYLRLFPGEAVFFYTSTFHCSFINSTEEDRVAVLLNLVPKNIETIYCHKKGNTIEKYSMNTNQLYENLHQFEEGREPLNLKLISTELLTQKENNNIKGEDLIQKITTYNKANGLFEDYEVKQTGIFRDQQLEVEMNKNGYLLLNNTNDFSILSKNISDSKSQSNSIIKNYISSFFYDYNYHISLKSHDVTINLLGEKWTRHHTPILNDALEPYYILVLPIEKSIEIELVPLSHRILKALYFENSALDENIKYLEVDFNQKKTVVSLSPKQALLFDIRLLHRVQKNNSAQFLIVHLFHQDTKDFIDIEFNSESNQGNVYKLTVEEYFGIYENKGLKEEMRKRKKSYPMSFFEYPLDKHLKYI